MFEDMLVKAKIDAASLDPTQLQILRLIYQANLGSEMMAIEKMQDYHQSGRIGGSIISTLQKLNEEAGPQVNYYYQHVNGIKVVVIANGLEEATMEHVVIYHHADDAVIWVRPASVFKERFRFIGKRKNTPNLAAVQAGLEHMARPYEYLRKKAELEGTQIDGLMAVRYVEDHHWYQELAEKLLQLLKD